MKKDLDLAFLSIKFIYGFGVIKIVGMFTRNSFPTKFLIRSHELPPDKLQQGLEISVLAFILYLMIHYLSGTSSGSLEDVKTKQEELYKNLERQVCKCCFEHRK